MKNFFIYDLTCLISQQVSETPSGTIRVDLRYAHYLLTHHAEETVFVKQQGNRLIVIAQEDAKELINHLLIFWGVDASRVSADSSMALSNLEFRMQYHGLWDPDLDTFFSMPFMDRFNFLLNQELTEIFGTEFKWVRRLPHVVRIIYAMIASLSRYPAMFLLRLGQFIGVLLHTRRLRSAYRFITAESRQKVYLANLLQEQGVPDAVYHYIYTAYNRGFTFNALKRISNLIKLRYTVFIHDLIIIYYPEYFLPVNHEEQLTWLKALLTLEPVLIANSAATRGYLERFAGEHHRKLKPVITSHIGVEPAFLSYRSDGTSSRNGCYFVIISTIEPRKNHLMLLNIWREIAIRKLVDPVPELYLVGKRGWENENIVDMVERCRPLKGIVHELSSIKDSELISLLAGARALLYPSFCEGWGMPVAEALTLGTPTICSDIPELRESGQNIPDYISPIDGAAWMQAVIDYSSSDSGLRASQMERIGNYRPPTWEEHFKISMGGMLGSAPD